MRKWKRNKSTFIIHWSIESNVRSGLGHLASSDDNVDDGDMNQFDKEPNKAHETKSDGYSVGNLGEFTAVWLCTADK